MDIEKTFGAELLACARAARPVLARHAADTEREGRPAKESQEAAAAAGAFALTTPHRFGGLEVDLVTQVEFLEELGRGCPSTAWVASTTAEAERFFTPMMDGQQLAELYAQPDARLCGAGAPPGRSQVVSGGVRLSGRWPYASGCEDARCALVMTTIVDSDRFVRVAPVLLPTSDLQIERTWNVAGLQGTGSHTLLADDVFVPESMILDMPASPNGLPDPSARPEALVTNALCLIGPMLGAAQGALDVVSAVMGTRKPPFSSYDNLAASPGGQHLFAEAVYFQRSARQRVLAAAGQVDRLGGTGVLSDLDRAGLVLDIITAGQECRRSVDVLLDLHGSSGFRTSNPLQRFWRDLNIGTRHAVLTSYRGHENYARLLVGGV